MPRKRGNGDGGLYFDRRKKLWRAVVELEPRNGKRRQKVVTSRNMRTAKEKLDRLNAEINEHGEPLDRSERVNDWADRWLSDYVLPEVDPKTYSTYASLTKRWIKPVIGHVRVSDLKPSHVLAVRKNQRAEGKSLSTQRQTYIVLSRMLEQARRENLSSRNVALDIDPPGGRKGKTVKAKEVPAIDPEALFKMLAIAKTRKNGSLWWAKILTGMRQGEILGAVIEDLNIETGIYEVNWKLEELVSDHGCGDRTEAGWPCGKSRGGSCPQRRPRVPEEFDKRQLVGRLYLTGPKSKVGKRVPFIAELVDMVRRDLQLMSNMPNPHGLIWRHDDGRPILPKEEAAAWRELLHEAGIISEAELLPGATKLTGHAARHSFITIGAEVGIDMQLLGEIAGHGSERVTQGYRHARDAERMRAMEAIGATLLTEATDQASTTSS